MKKPAIKTKKGNEAAQGLFYGINNVKLSETGQPTSRIEVLRVGVIRDRGLVITQKMLSDFVQNFNDGVYGTDLQVNLSHNRDGEAAGWIKDLIVEGQRLMADIEWTPLGEDKLTNRLFKFVSSEFASRFPHHETGKLVDNVFIGLALTNVPALKGQSAISLSEDIDLNNLKEFMTFKNYIENLSARAVVSKDDKAFAKSQFEALSEEEQAEAKETMEAVEAKPETTPEEKAPEKEEGKKTEEEGEKQPEKPKVPEGTEELAEKMQTIETQLSEERALRIELADKLDTQQLSEAFDKNFMLNEAKGGTGLLASSKDKVIAFMRKLSTEDRKEFETILQEVKHVDLSTRGGEGVSTEGVDESDEVEAKKLSAEKGIAYHIALAEVYSAKEAKNS